jgi:hypothetical protein
MADRKLTTNPLVSDGDDYQTTVNCRSVIQFLANGTHQGSSDAIEWGRSMVLLSVAEALKSVEHALEPGKRGSLEVVNG